MVSSLARVAVGGFAVGIVFLSLAWATGGDDLKRLGRDFDLSFDGSCHDKISGTAQAERRLAFTGDTVMIALPAIVRYRAGEGSEVVVRGPAGLISQVEVRGNRIIYDRNYRGRCDLEVVLPGQAFRTIHIAGSAALTMEQVDQPELGLTLSGSGSVRAKGKVERLTLSIHGSAQARLGELAAKEVKVTIAGSGNVEAAPTELADINLSGSGNVRLLTRPATVRSQVAGSGRIVQASADGKK